MPSSSSSDRSPAAKNTKKRGTSTSEPRSNLVKKRRGIIETLESRQLLAGPQLIGIQPNEGERIDDGAVRSIAPRVLTFRFDETQQIDAATLSGIQITRAGTDGVFGVGPSGASDDIRVTPGLVTLGDPNQNEVVVRFAENLPDDSYRLSVFGFDDRPNGITGLRNVDGELFRPATPGASQQSVDFRLDLGALVESIVPQPVVRNADGSLTQNRNEIVVYFNEDPLFVQNDPATGLPTTASAENPQFYQLLLTKDTARTTDDALFLPERVVYDSVTHTARLFFAKDINALTASESLLTSMESAQRVALTNAVTVAAARVNTPQTPPLTPTQLVQARADLRTAEAALAAFEGRFAVPVSGGTFRLRIGTRVESRMDLIVQPTPFNLTTEPGETMATSVDVGTFTNSDRLASFVLSQSISAQSNPAFGLSTDIDLYRFEVDLNDDDRLGRFTAETFAERLPTTSNLDTAISLFREQRASATSNFRVGSNLLVRFTAVADGAIGNNVRINFIQTDRAVGDTAVRVLRVNDTDGALVNNAILIDIPRNRGAIAVSSLITAINSDAFASSLMTAELAVGAASTNIAGQTTPFNSIVLEGGGLVQVARNDDYFSEDSFLSTLLGTGTYYIGVTASGNDEFDPTIAGSGANGGSAGVYELLLKFEPQVDEINVLRDRDGDRLGVPGTPIDGDGDGTPGGVNNFWFQTRSEKRVVEFNLGGDAITANQTISITGGNGIIRIYEFVPTGGTKIRQDSIAVSYSNTPGFSSGAANLAEQLATAINLRESETGVTVLANNGRLTFTGERTLSLSSNFRGAVAHGRVLFVDKTGPSLASGSLLSPFNNIASTTETSAFPSALPGDIVRIVGNGGTDRLLQTEGDNFAYQFGLTETGGRTLSDGRNMEIPRGVTTIIDAGAVLKFRNAYVVAGSTSLQIDRSGSILQVLGTPRLVNLSTVYTPNATTPQTDDALTPTLIAGANVNAPNYDDGSVIFTSTRDRAVATTAAGNSPDPTPGDWGGLIYRNDFDRAQGRATLESQAIFLDVVNHAELRYGGGSNLQIESSQQLVNPISIVERRPSVTFNEITSSADAAISASPDSFQETTFQSPNFQAAGAFLADYDRVGPDIYGNQLVNNSINGMFIRIVTSPNAPPAQLTVSGRFDDIDVVHHFAENLVVVGTPGTSFTSTVRPDLTSTSAAILIGGNLQAASYTYRMTFIDAFGFESSPSDPSAAFVVANNNSSIDLRNLPPVNASENFVARRLYRSVPGTSNFVLIAELNANSQSFRDSGERNVTNSTLLVANTTGVRGRLDASLNVDPGIITKFNTARIELGEGTQLLAEGTPQRPVIFTSLKDDRYGAGGTFDTNNDRSRTGTVITPARGDWSGIYAFPGANVSFDSVVLSYGGGISPLPGGQLKGFVPLQLNNATARVVGTRFEFNDDGQDGAGPDDRFGRGIVSPSVIHVGNSQPVIVGNSFIDNRGSIIDIDVNSMTGERLTDRGRQTGPINQLGTLDDNYGPLIRLNRYQNVANSAVAERQFSVLEIRGGTLRTESVWDDTDIVHALFGSVVVDASTPGSGLRLTSRAEESLVVKLSGAGNVHSPTSGTGITATGLNPPTTNFLTGQVPGTISAATVAQGRGGTVQIVGMPGSPVILTSLNDDAIGAGLTPNGTPFLDNNGDAFGSRPDGNDWRSILFDEYANLANVEYVLERELATEANPGLNGFTATAQFLGGLSPTPIFSDELNRAGYEVEGFLEQVADVDTYSFNAEAGTQVWVDLDATSFTLDTILEVLNPDGQVIARSDNSDAEVAGTPLSDVDPTVESLVGSLQATTNFEPFVDANNTNPRNAGLRLTLPGPVGQRSNYFVRVRSASINPDDAQGGLTRGGYRFQIRLQEDQVFSGSVVKYADIRYANHGIHVRGAMSNSPLLGEAQENEQFGATSSNNIAVTSLNTPGQRAQYLGDLSLVRNNTLSVGGALSSIADVDNFQIDVSTTLGGRSVIFDIDYADGLPLRPNTQLALFYDPDGENGDQQPRLVAVGTDSNVLEDQALGAGMDPIEQLSRGSNGNGDPFIGPLTLPAGTGTYYIAVTGDGITPDVLNDPLVRLEPIDSILRVFDDQIGNFIQTTADPPLNASFIDTRLLPFGWSVTTARARDVGHNARQTFNGSRNVNLFPDALVIESESNNAFVVADQLDLPLGWSLNDDPNVGDTFGNNTSRLLPHIKALGTTVNEIVDVFQFTVPVDGSRVILDIDNGFNPFTIPGNAGFGGVDVGDIDIEDFQSDSVDLKLQLFSAAGVLLATNSLAPVNDGALGSIANQLSLFSQDPFIETILSAGTYFVAVSPEATAYDAATGVFSLAVADRPQSGTYELNVSVENFPVNGGDPNNQSLLFDRSEFRGELTSVPFDLRGYSAGDQPVLYFDYLLSDIGLDDVRVVVESDQTGPTLLAGNARALAATGTAASLLTNNNAQSFFQARLDLSAFAGDTNITVRFEYTTDLAAGVGQTTGAEGLYLDNFIVGFAERGELVVGAPSGQIGFSGQSTGGIGAYQLEVRTASGYFAGGQPALTLNTNDRLAQSTTIVAPYPNQIVTGDTFELSDNVRSATFQFTEGGSPIAGNIAIDISVARALLASGQAALATAVTPAEIAAARSTITQSQVAIADAIRSAINSPAVQAIINIQAGDGSGSATGGNNDVLVALSGFVVGDLTRITSAGAVVPGQPLPGTGTGFTLPTLFNNLFGDANTVRLQDQVVVESNKISDVRAIGIWVEPGERGVDPQDIKLISQNAADLGDFFGFNQLVSGQANPFLQQPPIGNSLPGAVRNLPVINNSVIGGLAPGAVVVNNTIDNAGFAGIKVDGEIRPWQIDGITAGDFLGDTGFGDGISDGLTMIVDSGNTRVTFEFEDIGGGVTPAGGSGVIGGNGVVDGHVPIHYRRSSPSPYNPPNVPVGARRNYAHTRHEVMMAIHQAIQGSILVTNGLVELVHSTVGPSIVAGSEVAENRYLSAISFPSASVFLEGVSGIYFDTSFANGGANPLRATQSAVAEAPQSLARIINNTIYGADGTESTFTQPAVTTGVDNDDLISGARDTKISGAHTGPYITTGTIGNPNPSIAAASDVDMYEVELKTGDRLVVDIDTLIAGGPNTTLRLFNASGIVVATNESGIAPNYLETAANANLFDAFVNVNDPANPADDTTPNLNPNDPFLEFTATVPGTYYVAVSSAGNDNFSVQTLSGRTPGTGGVGAYRLAIESYAPRSFVISIDDQNQARVALANNGTVGADVIGTSVFVTQISDLIPGASNTIEFIFTNGGGGGGINANGDEFINVPIRPEFFVQEIITALASAINGYDLSFQGVAASPLPNGGSIGRAVATSLGGLDGDGPGSEAFAIAIPFPFGTGSDFQYGYGHDRTSEVNSVGFGGTTTTGRGTTERYILVENVSQIVIGPGSPLRLDPQAGRNIDQLLPETGVLLTGGTSATVFNNVFANLNESMVVESSAFVGFGGNPAPDITHPKLPLVAVTSNAFQHDDPNTALFRQNINAVRNSGVGSPTDLARGPSNVNGGTDDRNNTLLNNEVLFVNANGDRFLPSLQSTVIDSGTSSVTDRDAFVAVKQSIGLPVSNILAPTRDGNGVRRADNALVAPSSGVGGDLFTDRGANELADFNGPVAIIENPLDNDGGGLDGDAADSFIALRTGNLTQFTIQLRDTGDSSDPFAGLGIDDNTVVVSAIPGLRPTGANLTLFESDRLLTEGIDYTFSYNATSSKITLTPLSGVWRNDRSYRVSLNNRDRTVLIAPSAAEIADGDQVRVTDSAGGQVVFEFETGYQLFLPEVLTLILPADGASTSIRDGDVFQISDTLGRLVTFEFDRDGSTLADRILIRSTLINVPADEATRLQLLQGVVTDINNAVGATGLLTTTQIETVGTQQFINVRVTSPASITATGPVTQVDPQTIRIAVPAVGTSLSGGLNQVSFTIQGAGVARTFGFATGGAAANNGAVPVIGLPTGNGSSGEIAQRIQLAIAGSGLNLETVVVPSAPTANPAVPNARVLIGAPAGTTLSTGGSGLSQDGRTLSLRIPASGNGAQGVTDGATITLSNGRISQTFEFQGDTVVNDPSAILINIQNPLLGNQVALAVANAVSNSPLRLVPLVDGNVVFLNLPSAGTATTLGGNLRVQGLARPIVDGDTIAISEQAQASSPAIQIGLAYPAGQLLATPAVQAIDGQIITVGNGTNALRIELFASATSRTPAAGTRQVDLTVTTVNVTGEVVEVLATREQTAQRIAGIIRDAQIDPTGPIPLGLDGVAQDTFVFLDLDNSTATSGTGRPTLISAVPSITLNPTAQFVDRLTLEFDQTTTANPTGNGVFLGNVPVLFRSTDSASTLALRVAAILNANAAVVDGLNNNSFADLPGQIQIDTTFDPRANPPLNPTVTVSANSSLQVRGTPGVTGGSVVEVFGPLLLELPLLGGVSINDGSVLTLRNDVGQPQVFQFQSPTATFTPLPGAIVVPYAASQTTNIIAATLANAINGANLGINATVNGLNVSLGRIDSSRASNADVGGFTGAAAIAIRRGIVTDGETLVIRQGNIAVTYEFVNIAANRDAAPGNVQVSFQVNNTPGDLAESLAAAIRNSPGELRFTLDRNGVPQPPEAITDANGNFTGAIEMNVVAGTQIDVSNAPTLFVTGVPGGAQPIAILPSQSDEEVRIAILRAIRGLQNAPGGSTTTLQAEDRGGNTIFIENAAIIEGPIANYFLPAIKDVAGNDLEANRSDRTTQFTILMPEIGLDFGDAPDPVTNVPGRYPTALANNGSRHVISTDGPTLGRLVDPETDGRGVVTADGDDTSISVTETGDLFTVAAVNGGFEIIVNFQSVALDGSTVTINTGANSARFEYDTDGIFDEDNFAIRPADTNGNGIIELSEATQSAITAALRGAIAQSGLQIAGITTINSGATTGLSLTGDDEDGVRLLGPGVFNRGVVTRLEVDVTGVGVLQGWVDFNADGDFTDPGENILDNVTFDTRNPDESVSMETLAFNITIPTTTSIPGNASVSSTYARFRVSRNGGLEPTGLALSGEVEDYRVPLLPGLPPVSPSTARSYAFDEGSLNTVSDLAGLLQGTSDPDGQGVEIYFPDPTANSLVLTRPGQGILTINRDGSFSFEALGDYSGTLRFESEIFAKDIALNSLGQRTPALDVVSSTPIVVNITVRPVNDAPLLRPGIVASDVITVRTINEDNVVSQANQTTATPVIFDAADLIAPYYLAGPGSEPIEQRLEFVSAGSNTGFDNNRTLRGGTLSISTDRQQIIYTPPADYSGALPDSFSYIVGDNRLPGEAIFATLSAGSPGRVQIIINPINDNPRVTNDSYSATENTVLRIPVRGAGTGLVGILDNDSAGPADELAPPQSQTISLRANQFERTLGGQIIRNRLTQQGGTVALSNDGTELIYTPRSNFAGIDRFTYIVRDSLGAESTATVAINVGNTNNAPEFIGVSGIAGRTTLSSQERKTSGVVESYDLNVWFRDPDNDAMSYSAVIVAGAATVIPRVVNNQLQLEYIAFASGTTTLQLTATDVNGSTTTQNVTLTVDGTPDPPTLTGSFNPTVVLEDATASLDLTSLFIDRDNDPLTYTIERLGNLTKPTAAQIAGHPLVRSIEIVGNQLIIRPQPDQFGSVNIEISAFDGTFTASHNFRFDVLSVQDAPRGGADSYNVPIGGRLQIADPLLGLLANDRDPDQGNTVRMAPGSLTQPQYGTVTLDGRTDGAFTYTFNLDALPDSDPIKQNPALLIGQTDTFTYRPIDSTGVTGLPVTVSITFNNSAFQNPFNRFDVTADGFVTALDALRVINFLNSTSGGNVPVSQIGDPPPDFLDVSGDGTVSALDSLQVINELNRRSSSGILDGQVNGEPISSFEAIMVGNVDSGPATRFASTTTHATLATANLGGVNAVPKTNRMASGEPMSQLNDPILAIDAIIGGVEIDSSAGSVDRAAAVLVPETKDVLGAVGVQSSQSDRSSSVDAAIDSVLGELHGEFDWAD